VSAIDADRGFDDIMTHYGQKFVAESLGDEVKGSQFATVNFCQAERTLRTIGLG
jgi:hypothetical protein